MLQMIFILPKTVFLWQELVSFQLMKIAALFCTRHTMLVHGQKRTLSWGFLYHLSEIRDSLLFLEIFQRKQMQHGELCPMLSTPWLACRPARWLLLLGGPTEESATNIYQNLNLRQAVLSGKICSQPYLQQQQFHTIPFVHHVQNEELRQEAQGMHWKNANFFLPPRNLTPGAHQGSCNLVLFVSAEHPWRLRTSAAPRPPQTSNDIIRCKKRVATFDLLQSARAQDGLFHGWFHCSLASYVQCNCKGREKRDARNYSHSTYPILQQCLTLGPPICFSCYPTPTTTKEPSI